MKSACGIRECWRFPPFYFCAIDQCTENEVLGSATDCWRTKRPNIAIDPLAYGKRDISECICCMSCRAHLLKSLKGPFMAQSINGWCFFFFRFFFAVLIFFAVVQVQKKKHSIAASISCLNKQATLWVINSCLQIILATSNEDHIWDETLIWSGFWRQSEMPR